MTEKIAHPPIATYEAWLAARKELLAEEKALTRPARRGERETPPPADGAHRQAVRVRLTRRREDPPRSIRRPPSAGRLSLHVRPGVGGRLPELHRVRQRDSAIWRYLDTRDTRFALISRAPSAKLERYKAKRGWNVPWYSSYGSDFNYDFHVTFDENVAPFEHNFRTKAELQAARRDALRCGREPGIERVLPDRRQRIPQLFDLRARRRRADEFVQPARHHSVRPSAGLRGFAARLAAAPDLRLSARDAALLLRYSVVAKSLRSCAISEVAGRVHVSRPAQGRPTEARLSGGESER